MPPIRTAKKNTSAADHAPTAKEAWQKLLKPIGKGQKDAYFKTSSPADWDDRYERVIGTSTRTINFETFVLTDHHIDSILAMGSTVCEKLWQFIFSYWDVSYTAKNTAKDVTDDAAIRLAKACPNLRKVQLQGIEKVGEGAMRALFENCPNLTSLEITCTTNSGIWKPMSGETLDALRENPGWAPKLKNLIVSEREDNKVFMKAMRALGKARPRLTVTLVSKLEYKKWGDYEIEVMKTNYKKGRIQQHKMGDYQEFSGPPGWWY